MSLRTYSFKDVHAAISGPGGNFPLAGDEAGVAEEGIKIEATGDKNVMTGSSDGSVMHSLIADSSGTITVTLLKTATTNGRLSNLYDTQTASATLHGQNTITIRDTARGDTITCSQVAFAKAPPLAYAKEGGTVEWVFHAGKISRRLS